MASGVQSESESKKTGLTTALFVQHKLSHPSPARTTTSPALPTLPPPIVKLPRDGPWKRPWRRCSSDTRQLGRTLLGRMWQRRGRHCGGWRLRRRGCCRCRAASQHPVDHPHIVLHVITHYIQECRKVHVVARAASQALKHGARRWLDARRCRSVAQKRRCQLSEQGRVMNKWASIPPPPP